MNLEKQEIINSLVAENRRLKTELTEQIRARQLLRLRVENAVTYLSGNSHHDARINAALSQLQQGINGK